VTVQYRARTVIRELLHRLNPFRSWVPSDGAAVRDRKIDAATETIVNGSKMMGPTGTVTDFDADQKPPRY
jgi:hypothetical protein